VHHMPLPAFFLDDGETLIVVTNLPFEKSDQYHYLRIFQNRREGTKTIQRAAAPSDWIRFSSKDKIESLVELTVAPEFFQ
jgi:hypothetical protein